MREIQTEKYDGPAKPTYYSCSHILRMLINVLYRLQAPHLILLSLIKRNICREEKLKCLNN